VVIVNKLDTIYRVANPARLDILTCLVEKKPNNIQELVQLLQRDYANVWRDVQALNSLRVIKLKKEGKEIKPIALYEKITIELPIVSPEKCNRPFLRA
jgi:predicted transcriptional regulator